MNPYPNVSAPGQPQVCEAGKTNFIPGQAVIGNAPASAVQSGTRIHHARQNLFGETYSSSQKQALGITTSKGKKK